MQRPSPSRDSITSPKRPATGKKAKSSPDLEIDNQSLHVELQCHMNLLIGLNVKLIVFNIRSKTWTSIEPCLRAQNQLKKVCAIVILSRLNGKLLSVFHQITKKSFLGSQEFLF